MIDTLQQPYSFPPLERNEELRTDIEGQGGLSQITLSAPPQGPPVTIMASFLDNAYSLVHQDNAADQPSQQDLKVQLEKGNDESKEETMKRILTIMLNGDPMPNLLMHIIRFVMPSKSKSLKKLLYFYYEICPKHDASGKLKQEMILVWYVFNC